MKPRMILLGISVVLSLLIASLLPANPTLAVEPDRETGQSKTRGEDGASVIDALWSSGWVDIATSESIQFTHNMGGDIEDYAIQMWFNDTDDGYGVNNRGYGSIEDNGPWSGAFWRSLTNTTITVGRQPTDPYADQVRVWIWPSQADLEYCTGWTAIAKGATATVVHNLGGDVDDYVVKLWFRDPSPSGVHQIYFGGVEDEGYLYGAYWYGLNTTQVQVTRNAEDEDAEEFLLCVSVPDPPDWNSEWQDISPGETITLTHGLGGNINRYIVRTEFKEVPLKGAPEDPMAIHQFAYGGEAVTEDALHVGANWQNLTNQNISVYRWADDPYADQVRVRIWLRRLSTYLPVVFKNYP
jgi:hypothetical protein